MRAFLIFFLFLGLSFADELTNEQTQKTLEKIQMAGMQEILNGSVDMDKLRELHGSNGEVFRDFSEAKFPIKGIHKKLGLTCKNCHLEEDPKDFSSAMNKSCMACHGDYKKLAEITSVVGHNDNPHASPHYETLDCDNCHKAHKQPVNMCLLCHTQDSMKKLVVK